MKVAVVNDFFPPNTAGGADLFLGKLSEYLSKENEVVVLTSDNVKGSTNFRTYKIKSSPFKFGHMRQIPGFTLPWLFFNSSLRKKIKEIYRKERIDVVYLNNIYHLSFAPLQAAHDLGLRTVLDAHDYWPVCFSKDKYRNDKKTCEIEEGLRCSLCLAKKFKFPFIGLKGHCLLVEKVLKRKELGKVDEMICHSDFVSERLGERGYTSEVIPYPYFGKVPEEPEREMDEFRILFAGRLNRNKGADLVLPVAKALKGRVNFKIDVLGEGPLSEKLKKEDLNIKTRGFVGEEEKFKFFKRADLLLAPSRWPEPFGIVALEAMAYQLPVVALEKSGGLKNLVKENEIGITPQEKEITREVIKLVRDQGRMESFRANCKKSIQKYGKETLFEHYGKFLKG